MILTNMITLFHIYGVYGKNHFFIDRVNSEISQKFILKPQFSFLTKNQKNYNQGEFIDFYELTLYMIFTIFHKKTIPIMTIFLEIFKDHIKVEFVDIIFVIVHQKSQ